MALHGKMLLNNAIIRNALLSTTPIRVPCMKFLMARGWIEVVVYGDNNTCP